MYVNITLIISLLIVVLLAYRGYKKGLLRVIFGIVAVIFMVLFTAIAEPFVTEFLDANTPIRQNLTDLVVEDLNERVDEISTDSNEVQFVNSLPYALSKQIKNKTNEVKDTAVNNTAAALSDRAMRGISSIVTMLAGIIIVLIVRAIIMGIGHMPIIGGLNRFLGFILGFVEGISVVWVIMYFASVFVTSIIGHTIVSDCNQNTVLYYLFEANPIVWCLG